MTYIVGTVFDGVGVIIADSRITPTRDGKKGQGVNGWLKIGLLCTGCIYGGAGNVRAIQEFVCAVRSGLPKRGELKEVWRVLEDELARHQFTFGDFELALCSRHNGRAEIYHLCAKSRTIVGPCESTLTLGSGKELLDDDLLAYERDTFYEHWSGLRAVGHDPRDYGYLYCRWLIERSRGEDAVRLEEEGVGGLFCFMWQDHETEGSQGAAHYVFLNLVVPESPYLEAYHLAMIENALHFTDAHDGDWWAFDPATFHTMGEDEAWGRVGELDEKEKAQPYYQYLGYCIAQAQMRSGDCSIFAARDEDCLIDWTGYRSDESKARVLEIAERLGRHAMENQQNVQEGKQRERQVIPAIEQVRTEAETRLAALEGYPCIGYQLRFAFDGERTGERLVLLSAETTGSRIELFLDRFGFLACSVAFPEPGPAIRIPVHADHEISCQIAYVQVDHEVLLVLKGAEAVATRVLPSEPRVLAARRDVYFGCDAFGKRGAKIKVYERRAVVLVDSGKSFSAGESAQSGANAQEPPLFSAGPERPESGSFEIVQDAVVYQRLAQEGRADLPRSRALLARALQIWTELDDTEGMKCCFRNLFLLYLEHGAMDEAEQHFLAWLKPSLAIWHDEVEEEQLRRWLAQGFERGGRRGDAERILGRRGEASP